MNVLCLATLCLLGPVALGVLLICQCAGEAEERAEIMRRIYSEPLRPQIGETLMGQGQVVEHKRLIDSAGVFHGLCLLVIEREGEGYPDIDVWCGFLPPDSVSYAAPDHLQPGRLQIWYKLAKGIA